MDRYLILLFCFTVSIGTGFFLSGIISMIFEFSDFAKGGILIVFIRLVWDIFQEIINKKETQ